MAATIRSSEVAVHYGQHFIPSAQDNALPGVISVTSDTHYVSLAPPPQLPQMQQQKHRHPIPDKPTILNHTLNVSQPILNQDNSVVMKLDQHSTLQPHMQILQPPPVAAPVQQQQQMKMWLLVEWEMPAGEPSTYSIIDSSELVLHNLNGRTRETIHTGKTIYVKRKNRVQQATVVIISDDKQFIETELTQLRKMAAENLQRMVDLSQEYGSANKRRRMESTATITIQDDQEPISPEFEPIHPVQMHAATANWVAKCKPDRVLSPSPSVMSSAFIQPAAPPRLPPPMTFDQQTQTDAKFFPNQQDEGGNRGGAINAQELAKILSLQESILAEQKSVRMESEYNRKVMLNMAEQLNSFSETLKQLVTKVDSTRHEYKYEITEVMKSPAQPAATSYVVLGTGGEESRDHASSTAGSLIQKPETADTQLVMEQITMHDDSNASFNNSRFSAKEDNSTSTPKNLDLSFSKRISSSALSLSNASAYSQHSSNDTKSVLKDVLKDWNDDETAEDGELSSIGPNNTMVKRQILRAINWTNYKAATRKLLMTLFTREMLATHTLTGRPSPAFMGDRAKPVKDKLDQKIIADIVAIVSKSCNVTEPMVRMAITTKCADENKMNKMKSSRSSAGSAQTSMKQFVKDAPPVESGQGSPAVPEVPSGRRTKRDNKENFH